MGILAEIISSLAGDAPVKEVRIGPFWTAVWSRRCGLASTTLTYEHHGSLFPVREAGNLTSKSALELSRYAASDSLIERALALAAVNSLLEVDPTRCRQANAADVLAEWGKDKRVCVVGHFPFVPRLKKVARELSVLERRPLSGDLPASEAESVIPEADVVAITGTALINGSMEKLLALCSPGALVMVLGPTTPLSSVWFAHGVRFVSGTRVTDPALVLRLVSEGVTFQQLHGRGVELLTMEA
ncbi:MAG TPA: DUF364 domain-containing protein [Firmicutes bacterium]|nr:DUF364 domain-containing protein [Bacillota bacterium]